MQRSIPILMSLLLVLPASALAQSGFSMAEIRDTARSLAREQKIPADKLTDLMIALEPTLARLEIGNTIRSGGVSGVFVFNAIEAGVVVKYMQGDGRVSFREGRRSAPIHLRTWSAGVQVGGSALWGVGLVADLQGEAGFGGEYRGVVMSATAADSTTRRPIQLRKHAPAEKAGHRIFVTIAGRGLSADAGISKMTISPTW
jgi:hypothetical protein